MSWIDKAVKEIGESLMYSEGAFWPHRIKEIIERHVGAPQPPEKAGAAPCSEGFSDCTRKDMHEHFDAQPTPPPQGPGREGDSEFQNLLRYAYILSELPEVKMSDDLSVSLPTLRRWMKGESLPHEAMRPSIITKIRQMLKTASHPVEGKARPSCPKCGDVALDYLMGEDAVACRGKCGERFHVRFISDFIKFFAAPAPPQSTPHQEPEID